MLCNTSTKYTPHEVTHGFVYKSYMDNILHGFNKIKNIQKSAAANNLLAKKVQSSKYNERTGNVGFNVNEWVMLHNYNKKKFLDPIRVGPFQVIKILDRDNYLVYNHYRDIYLPYNTSQLYKYTKPIEKLVYGPVSGIIPIVNHGDTGGGISTCDVSKTW